MKVEAGESLILSWLRHVMGCQIVQLNWKPSVDRWRIHDEALLSVIAQEAKQHFFDQHEISIFNKGEPSQLIRQGEIDVLGLHRDERGNLKLYAVDSANHHGGLNLGVRSETIARVLKKLVRSAISAHGFFPGVPGEILFVAPKVDRQTQAAVEERIGDVNEILARHFLPLKTRLICNEEYATDIIEPVLDCANVVTDTSELFLRSIQLARFVDRPRPAARPDRADKGQEAGDVGLPLIGRYVQDTVKAMTSKGQIPEDEIERLLHADYSSRTFGLTYPFFKEHDPTLSPATKQYYLGEHGRYYARPYQIGSRSFYLCNYWYAKHRMRFDAWVDRMLHLSGAARREIDDVTRESGVAVSDLDRVAAGDTEGLAARQ